MDDERIPDENLSVHASKAPAHRFGYFDDDHAPHEYTDVDLARELKACREAIECLMAEQNGPPLIRNKDSWKAAMVKCSACLPGGGRRDE